MLLPTMTNAEVHLEILRDYEQMNKVTIPRLHQEYFKERQKLKIEKTKLYPKTYRIKTASKNNWIVVLTMASDVPRHRSMMDQQAGGIVYYFAKDGYRFFRPLGKDKPMEMFYGHFFTRYNQRMGLNLANHPDIAAHFFAHNSSILPLSFVPDSKNRVPYICKDGIALGELWGNPNWRVYKTFITHNLKHRGQREEEQRMQDEVLEVLYYIVNHMDHKDPNRYRAFKGGLEQIFGSDHILTQTLKSAHAAAKPATIEIPKDVLAAQREIFAPKAMPAYMGGRLY